MADQTIVNYELVEKYSKEFEDQAECMADSISTLKLKAQGLENFWKGKAAEKFFDEFHQEILPATIRLHAVLLLSAESLRKIITLFETSDEECASYFSESALDSDMAASGVGDLGSGSGGGGGGGGGTADQSKGMEGNLRMGVAGSGQGTGSPGTGTSSESGGMADHIYDTGSDEGGRAAPDSPAPAASGGGADQADSSNLPKAAGGIAGAAAAGAAAKKKKDKNDNQD